MPLDTAQSPGPGHNGGGPTPEDKMTYMREWRSQKRLVDEAVSQLRLIDKRWKNGGVNIKIAKLEMQLEKLDREEAARDVKELVTMLVLRKVIPGEAVGPLFAGIDIRVTEKAQAEQSKWDAEDRGYRDGAAGHPIEDCPYPTGTEFHAVYRDYWHKGQRGLALGQNTKQANASRAKPGRKAAAGNGAAAALPAPVTTLFPEGGQPAKRGRGRPAGAKNRPKEAGAAAPRKRGRRAAAVVADGEQPDA